MKSSPSRRGFLQSASGLAGGLIIPSGLTSAFAAPIKNNLPPTVHSTAKNIPLMDALKQAKKSTMGLDLTPHSWEAITEYNNFIEFSGSKRNVAKAAEALPLTPWSVKISGNCVNPREYTLEELSQVSVIEERLFNQRCVEGWSRAVPWNGFSLNHLLKLAKPYPNVRFVEFRSFYVAEVMPFSRFYGLSFPYTEGLRLDEAMHPLTTIVFGIAGQALPRQSGGPVRLVVPWKYAFKSAKSLVEIRFVENQPLSTWSRAQPDEYGFYANVNPDVPHPRWSQSRERPLGDFFSRPTRPFNGFSDQVASLYVGMDLRTNY